MINRKRRNILDFLIYSSLAIMSKSCQTTTYTDACGNIGILWNCSGSNTDRLPQEIPHQLRNRNVTLDLSFNRFSTLNQHTFEKLAAISVVTSIILSYNSITKIENKTFQALTGLCSLDISYCSLDKESIAEQVFLNITNLKYLRIHHNNFQNEGYPDVALSVLQSLISLEIDIFNKFEFTKPFENLTSLSEVKFNILNDFSLTNTSFLGLKSSKIRRLNLTFINHVFCDVTEDLFCSFPYLADDIIINFGGRCDVTPALRSLKCLQHRLIGGLFIYENKPKIKKDIIVLNDKLCEYVVNICVRTLSLSANSIASITKNIYNTPLWNCLKLLDLSRNDLQNVDFSAFGSWVLAPNMKYLYYCCNNQHSADDSFNIYQYKNTEHVNITLPEGLEMLDFSKNWLHNIKGWMPRFRIYGEKLQELYIQETNFPLAYVDQFVFPSLKELNLSVNNFVNIHTDLFQSSRNIQSLSAVAVKLNFSTISNSKEIFKNMRNLYKLDFSKNNLNYLPPTLFMDQRQSLTEIHLDNNQFSSIPDSLRHLQKLITLFFRYNLISEFSRNDQKTLQTLKNISIYFEGNPISCTCSSLQSLVWMRNNRDHFVDLSRILCAGSQNFITHLFNEQVWRKFELKCQTKTWLIFSVVLILMTLSILFIIFTMQKYRVHVEYVILRLKNRCKDVFLENRQNNYKYDVFVSYSEYDYVWIIRHLYPKLESLNICAWLKDKDSVPGDWEAQEIVRCINESRKVLFVITECFLESGWASYAVQMAVTHAFHNQRQSSIVVIIKDDIPLERLPNDIKNIWWCIEYFRWPAEVEYDDLILVKLSNMLKPMDT